MKTLKDSPFLDGTVMSEDLSPVGKQIKVYLEYVGKITRVASEQQTVSKNEKVAGQEIFLKLVEKEENQRQRKLTTIEKKQLEKQTKFDLSPKKIGNSTPMFNAIFHEVTSENKHWHELIDSAKKEVIRLCTQSGAIDKLQNYDVRDDL